MTVQPTTAESIGWLPLGDGAYLHVGDPEALLITVVGVAAAGMMGMNERTLKGSGSFRIKGVRIAVVLARCTLKPAACKPSTNQYQLKVDSTIKGARLN